MTAQIPDRVRYRRKSYDLIGVAGTGLPGPGQIGLVPQASGTANYRGFIRCFTIRRGQLWLDQIIITQPAWHVPQGAEKRMGLREQQEIYQLTMTVDFTGTLRIAREFIDRYYIHMGFQKASAFGVVLDLRLTAGRVGEVTDRSAYFTTKRGSFKRYFAAESNVLVKIEAAFSLDLDIE